MILQVLAHNLFSTGEMSMKYLVISKPGNNLVQGASPDHIAQGKSLIQQGMDKGVIEGCYVLVGGGTVWIINVDSHADLARGLRKYGLVGQHQVDVHPILDAHGVLDAYHEHLSADTA
jgi:hypothetical protein